MLSAATTVPRGARRAARAGARVDDLVDDFILVGKRELPLFIYLLRKVNRRIMRGAALAKFAIDNACQVMAAM